VIVGDTPDASSTRLVSVIETWDLTADDMARVFGVDGPQVMGWTRLGVPLDQLYALWALGKATEILERHVRIDRISTVVRRRSDRLGGRSLLDLARERRYAEGLKAVVDTFDLRRSQP